MAKAYTKRIEVWWSGHLGPRRYELCETLSDAKKLARKLHKNHEGVVIDIYFYDQDGELAEQYTKHYFPKHFLSKTIYRQTK